MKFKVFISSRNVDNIVVNKAPGKQLSEIRIWLKDQLEAIGFLDQQFFDIRINESFAADATLDSYNACLQEVRESDLLISLFTGAAGWAPDGFDQGICHAELSEAMDISTKKTAIIDITKFFNIVTTNPGELERNDKFAVYIKQVNRFSNPLKLTPSALPDDFETQLLAMIKAVIYRSLLDRIKTSNYYYNISNNAGKTLDWKKMKYDERDRQIRDILNKLVTASPEFSKFIRKVHSIPDNMSVDDAKAFTGRPFLKDQDNLPAAPLNPEELMGPIHFVGVVGNATEIQVKNLIGYPDISVIKGDYGVYVWEQNNHIQMVFLTECISPEAVRTKFLLFDTWCQSTKELENIEKRGRARLHVLKAIIEAQRISQ
ncbi:MAG: hypothetical protein NT040_13650 [Bacteroidetes bacterium]|nr:hypothetical protein [Bacteroidota bacterium]